MESILNVEVETDLWIWQDAAREFDSEPTRVALNALLSRLGDVSIAELATEPNHLTLVVFLLCVHLCASKVAIAPDLLRKISRFGEGSVNRPYEVAWLCH